MMNNQLQNALNMVKYHDDINEFSNFFKKRYSLTDDETKIVYENLSNIVKNDDAFKVFWRFLSNRNLDKKFIQYIFNEGRKPVLSEMLLFAQQDVLLTDQIDLINMDLIEELLTIARLLGKIKQKVCFRLIEYYGGNKEILILLPSNAILPYKIQKSLWGAIGEEGQKEAAARWLLSFNMVKNIVNSKAELIMDLAINPNLSATSVIYLYLHHNNADVQTALSEIYPELCSKIDKAIELELKKQKLSFLQIQNQEAGLNKIMHRSYIQIQKDIMNDLLAAV